jgi:RNA-directed DNA polymerase
MAGERRPWITQLSKRVNPPGEEPVDPATPWAIATHAGWRAYQQVKAHQGAAGVDAESMPDVEGSLKDTLSKIGNRRSSGSYVPPPVRAVGRPQTPGGTSVLGMPTVGDSIAQMVAKEPLEPFGEPQFPPDSEGYRPGKSALQAVAVTRQRGWRVTGWWNTTATHSLTAAITR